MVQISTPNIVAFKGIHGERLMENTLPLTTMMFARDVVQQDTLDMLNEGIDEFITRGDGDMGDIAAARHANNLITVLVKTNPKQWVTDGLHKAKAKLVEYLDQKE